MKKTLLLTVVISLLAVGVFAQKAWNFSEAPFSVISLTESTDIDGLRILATGEAKVDIDTNNKKNGDFSFTHRLKTGGGGGPSPETPYLPTTRALSFNVSGPGEITVACLSSSSSEDRALIITNGVDSLGIIAAPGSYSVDGNTVPMETFQYTGGKGTIYIYSIKSGVNFYYLSSSSYSGLPSGVSSASVDRTIFYNGNEIINTNHMDIEVFDVLGKRVAKSNTHIPFHQFENGVYFVRSVNSNVVLKFRK